MNSDNLRVIDIVFLISSFNRQKIKIISISLITIFLIALALINIDRKFKINTIKFSFTELSENRIYRNFEKFYSDLVNGSKIASIQSNVGAVGFSINFQTFRTFDELIFDFTQNYWQEERYNKNLDINYTFSKKDDRSFSTSAIFKTKDIDFERYKDSIVLNFQNELKDFVIKRFFMIFDDINYQLELRINELKKANNYIVNNKDFKQGQIDSEAGDNFNTIKEFAKDLENVEISLALGDIFKGKNYYSVLKNNEDLIEFYKTNTIQDHIIQDFDYLMKDLNNASFFNPTYKYVKTTQIKPFFKSYYAFFIYFLFLLIFYTFFFSYLELIKRNK